MGAPRPVRRVLDLLEDLSQGRSQLSTGPFRIEGPLTALASPLLVSDETLEDAVFLRPTDLAQASGVSWRRLLERVGSRDVFLDLGFASPAELQELPEAWDTRWARARLQVEGSPESICRAAQGFIERGRRSGAPLTLVYAAEDGAAAQGVFEALLTLPDLREVELRIQAAVVSQSQLLTDWSRTWGPQASDRAMSVRLPTGEMVGADPVMDPRFAPAVMTEMLRSALRGRPDLCPHPWLTLSLRSAGGAAPCPRPDGPLAGPPESDRPWNGQVFQGVRAAFLAGSPAGPCAACTWLSRARGTLFQGLPPRPSRSMEV